MSKQRFAPPVLVAKKEGAQTAIVFANERSQDAMRNERYERFFPGVETAANNAPTGQDGESAEHPGSESGDAASPLLGDVGSPVPGQAPPEEALHAEIAKAFEDAAQEGFAAGIAQAQEQTQAKIDEHMRQMESMLNEIIDLRRTTFEGYQEQCLELAMAGAEALARQTLEHHKPALRELITDAMSELSGQDEVMLHVSPDNAEELQQWVQERFPSRTVQIIAEPEMQTQDFRAATKTGSVTGDFQERVQKLRQMILSHRGRLD